MRRKGKGSPTYKRSEKEFTERDVYDSDFTATLPLHQDNATNSLSLPKCNGYDVDGDGEDDDDGDGEDDDDGDEGKLVAVQAAAW